MKKQKEDKKIIKELEDHIDNFVKFQVYLLYGVGLIISSLALYLVLRFLPEKFNLGVLGIIIAGVICMIISLFYLKKYIKYGKTKRR